MNTTISTNVLRGNSNYTIHAYLICRQYTEELVGIETKQIENHQKFNEIRRQNAPNLTSTKSNQTLQIL